MTNTATQTENKSAQLSKAQENKLNGLPSTSAKIRYLDSLGWKRSAIAKRLGKRYQHVRNVLITPLTGKAK